MGSESQISLPDWQVRMSGMYNEYIVIRSLIMIGSIQVVWRGESIVDNHAFHHGGEDGGFQPLHPLPSPANNKFI